METIAVLGLAPGTNRAADPRPPGATGNAPFSEYLKKIEREEYTDNGARISSTDRHRVEDAAARSTGGREKPSGVTDDSTTHREVESRNRDQTGSDERRPKVEGRKAVSDDSRRGAAARKAADDADTPSRVNADRPNSEDQTDTEETYAAAASDSAGEKVSTVDRPFGESVSSDGVVEAVSQETTGSKDSKDSTRKIAGEVGRPRGAKMAKNGERLQRPAGAGDTPLGESGARDADDAPKDLNLSESEALAAEDGPTARGSEDNAPASSAASGQTAKQVANTGKMNLSGATGRSAEALSSAKGPEKNIRGRRAAEGRNGAKLARSEEAVSPASIDAQRRVDRVHEIEVNLSPGDEQSEGLQESAGQFGDTAPADGKDADASAFLTRFEHAAATPTQRFAGVQNAAQALARRLNGDLGTSIVRQAKIMLSESGNAEIRLIIRPPELGRVRINMQMENGHIAGQIIVDNGSVREVLEQNLAALERAFAEAGLDVGDFDVSTGDPRGETADDGSDDRRTGRNPRSQRGAGLLAESVEPIVVSEHSHRKINLVA